MIELKRARKGKAVLTIQVELDDDEAEDGVLGQILGGDEDLFSILYYNNIETVVSFVDRPAREATVHNLETGRDEAGPADFGFVAPEVVREEVPAVGAWYDNVVDRDARDNRFDQPAAL